MSTVAYRIAMMIKKADPDRTHSVEIMEYALGILLNTLFIIAASLLGGWLIGSLEQTVIALCSLAFLRMLSGGYHLKSAWLCNIVSIALCIGIPQVVIHIDISLFLMVMINAVSLIIMTVFSPRPDANANIPRKLYPALKLASIVIVCFNFVIISPVIGLAFLVQSLTIVPWRREVRI